MATGSSPASRWAWWWCWWCWSSSSSSFIISSSFSAISATDVTLRPTDWGFNSTTTAEGEQLRRQQRPYRILFSPPHHPNNFTSLYFPLHKTNIFSLSRGWNFLLLTLCKTILSVRWRLLVWPYVGEWRQSYAADHLISQYPRPSTTLHPTRLMYLHWYIFCLYCSCTMHHRQYSVFRFLKDSS